MKKIINISIIISFLFLGSNLILKYKDKNIINIDNESSFDVIFYFKSNQYDKIIVPSGHSYSKSSGNIELKYFESSPPNRVEYVIINKHNGTFIDLSPMKVIINNLTTVPVTLSAEGYLETDPMYNIQTGINDTSIIYTDTPVLTVTTDSFPASADYQVIDDIMYIVIK